MTFIAIICGLKSEAAAVRKAIGGDKLRIGVSGANADRAYELARAACQDGAAAVISVGVSGGLDPKLQPGDLVIGDEIIADDGTKYEADKYLLGAVFSSPIHEGGGPKDRRGGVFAPLSPPPSAARTPPPQAGEEEEGGKNPVVGRLFGSNAIIQSAGHKAALFQNHGAVAVDMESHGAARAAAEFSTPFLAIRAIADPADRALPKAAMNAVAPDGSTRALATLMQAAKAPGQFPALLQLGSDSEKALARLRRDLGAIFSRLHNALDL